MKLFVVVDENKQARGMLVYNKNKDKLSEMYNPTNLKCDFIKVGT